MQEWQNQILEREGFNKRNNQQKTTKMDLRNLTIERLEELIAINERKANQPMVSEKIKAQLADVKITLQRALDYKLQNA